MFVHKSYNILKFYYEFYVGECSKTFCHKKHVVKDKFENARIKIQYVQHVKLKSIFTLFFPRQVNKYWVYFQVGKMMIIF